MSYNCDRCKQPIELPWHFAEFNSPLNIQTKAKWSWRFCLACYDIIACKLRLTIPLTTDHQIDNDPAKLI